MIGRNMMFQQVTAVLALLLALPATAAAAAGSPAEPRGAMGLLVLSLVLQAVARNRRASRGPAAVAVAPQRTEP